MAVQRIQKFLAAAGIASRRACEEMVEAGRVRVNGKIIRTVPCLIDDEKDKIFVDGKPVLPTRHVYFLLNKPKGVFCTQNDPAARVRAIDLMAGVRERVFPVGRLDAESMGLLIMTNDGELTQKLTHPRFQTPKTYRAEVQGCPTPEILQQVREGVWLSEGRTSPALITIVHRQRESSILEITLRESRNREVRRMLAKVGHRVRRLTRIRIGRLSTQKLPLGAYRALTPAEVKYLYHLTENPHVDDSRSARPQKRDARATPETRRPAKRASRAGQSDTRPARPNKDTRQKAVQKAAPPMQPRTSRRIIRPTERSEK